MEWKIICDSKDVPAGKMKEFELEGKNILVSNIGGKFYAIDAKCSHMGGDLGKGKTDGESVICPKHHARFDMKTGKVSKNINGFFKAMTRSDAKDLQSYEIKEGEGKLNINL
jgi:nitrite reductase/ring-hydroxylating ferredoxin subunit